MLTKKLTIKEQNEILKPLFGLEHIEHEDCTITLYDEEGDEFYALPNNCQFDFSTLTGIFSYNAYIHKEKGKQEVQFNIRKELGI